MTEDTSIESHASEFNLIITNQNRIDVMSDDEEQALVILCSLPSFYKYL